MKRRGDALTSCRQIDGGLDKKTLGTMVRQASAGTDARSAATRFAPLPSADTRWPPRAPPPPRAEYSSQPLQLVTECPRARGLLAPQDPNAKVDPEQLKQRVRTLMTDPV